MAGSAAGGRRAGHPGLPGPDWAQSGLQASDDRLQDDKTRELASIASWKRAQRKTETGVCSEVEPQLGQSHF